MKTDRTPRSILDLELAWSDSSALAIKKIWLEKKCDDEKEDAYIKKDSTTFRNSKGKVSKIYYYVADNNHEDKRSNGVNAALENLWLDTIFFIPGYVLFLLITAFIVAQSTFKLNIVLKWLVWIGLFILVYKLIDPEFLPEKIILIGALLLALIHVVWKIPFKVLAGLIVCAGILDWTENYFLRQFLLNSSQPFDAVAFAFPATLKIGLLVFVSGFILIYGFGYVLEALRRFSGFAKNFLYILWTNRVITIVLFIIYFLLWKSDQGQDVLVNLNSKFERESHDKYFWGTNLAPLLLYLVLTIMAALHWFLPKYFFEKKSKMISWKSIWRENWNYGTDEALKKNNVSYQIFLARLFGVMTYIIPACGILKALDTFEIGYGLSFMGAEGIFAVSSILYILILYPFFDSAKSGKFCKKRSAFIGNNFLEEIYEWVTKRNLDYLLFILMTFLMVLVTSFGFFNNGHPTFLANLSLGLYIFSFIFAIIVSVRRRLGCNSSSKIQSFWRWFKERNINSWILSCGLLVSIIFLIFNLNPFLFSGYTISRTTTLIVVFTGLVFYVLLFSALILLGHKYKINFSAFLIATMIFAGMSFDNRFHDVETVEKINYEEVTLEKYIEQWLTSKREQIKSYRLQGKPFPVILVNAYGGGIRAAAWTSMVVNYLDDLVKENPRKIIDESFQDHVFAYSGASGGTIGASVLCALRKDNSNGKITVDSLLSFYQKDFLTPVVIGFLGRDVFFSTFDVKNSADRGKLQTQLWEKHLKDYADQVYTKDYASIWRDKNGKLDLHVPLLFSNTYHLESGRKGIVSPLTLDPKDFPSSVLLRNSLLSNQAKDVRFSTGSFLSARFPYISPAAKISSSYHFLDGGLKDNSGGETAMEIYKVWQRVWTAMVKEDSLYKDVEVLEISLNNMAPHEPELPKKNLFELTAPAQGLMNGWIGNTLKADSINKLNFGERYFAFKPLDNKIQIDQHQAFKPVLPLGWQISYPALIRLKSSLNYKNNPSNTYYRLLQKFSKFDVVNSLKPASTASY